MSEFNVPKVRARVMGSSSIRPVRMTEEADQVIKDVQATFKDFGQASVSMIVRAALAKYGDHIKRVAGEGRFLEMEGEWRKLSTDCHITRDKVAR